MKTQFLKTIIISLLLLLGGKAQGQVIADLPFINQSLPSCPGNGNFGTAFCGHTSAEMIMGYFQGRSSSQLTKANIQTYNTMIENYRGVSNEYCGTGTPNPNWLIWLFNQYGYSSSWYGSSNAPNYGNKAGTKNTLQELLSELNSGKVVMFQCGTNMGMVSQEHWMVLIGYNQQTDNIIVHDPGRNDGVGKYRQFTRSSFESSWTNSKKITLIVNPPITGPTINIVGNINAVSYPTSQGNNILIQGQEKNISFTLKNITNYTITRNFKLFLSNNGTTGNEVWNQSITFAPGQSYTYNRNTDASLGSVVNSIPGNYQLYLKGGTMALDQITMATTSVSCQTGNCNPQSITVNGTTTCTPPTTNLSSPSTGFTYNVGQNISLQWSGNGNSCTIQDYQIELTAPNGNIGNPIQALNYFDFTAPSNGTGTWQWRVRARNTNGVWGNYTNSRTFIINQSSNTYTISTTSLPSAGGSTTGNGTFASGSSRTVIATANSGYIFSNWTENGTVVSTNSSYDFTLNSNRNLVANFAQSNWTECPNYNVSPSNNANWNTHSSSIASLENKIYRFLVVPGRTYTFKTGCGNGATATFNTVLNLMDSNCNLITSNDNGCEQQRSTIEWTCNYASTGWVYLMVRGLSSSHYGNYTLAFNEIASSVATTEIDKDKSQIFPNPFNKSLQIKSENSDILEAQLLDLSGRIIISEKISKQKEYTIDTSKVPQGIYLLKIIKDKNTETYKVIKK